MADNNAKNKLIPEKQENAGRLKDGTFAPGVSGNPAGRPKRKTLTELIHAKLDDTPDGWEKLVTLVLYKLFTEKDKEVLKELWHYTDGMPTQKQQIEGAGGEAIKIQILAGNGHIPKNSTVSRGGEFAQVSKSGITGGSDTVQSSGVAQKG
jgi:hypothetical protein